MRICLCVQPDNTTLLAQHFGESGCYMVYDSETGQFSKHASKQAPCRGPCRCHVPELAGFDLVICRTIGHLVLRALRAQGTLVYQTQETDIANILANWQQLPPIGRAICKTGRRTAVQRPPIHKES